MPAGRLAEAILHCMGTHFFGGKGGGGMVEVFHEKLMVFCG